MRRILAFAVLLAMNARAQTELVTGFAAKKEVKRWQTSNGPSSR